MAMSWLTGYLLNKITEINSPVLDSSRCLRKTGGGDECAACVDTCPRKAFKPVKNRVKLEEDRCSACGFCVEACPTQALGYEKEKFDRQFERLGQMREPVLTCEKHPEKGHWKQGCLLSFHREALVLMALEWESKLVVFNLTGCENCDLGHREPGFQASWREVQQLLAALGKSFSLRQEKNAGNVPETVPPEVDRRAWFTSLSSLAQEKVKETGRGLISGEKPSGFPLRKAFLKAVIEKWPPEQEPDYSGGAFLAAYAVTEACDACGECERICRPGAWQMKPDKDHLKLAHEAGRCTLCRRCQRACNRKAIRQVNLTADRLKQAMTVKEWSYGSCTDCRRKQLKSRLKQGMCPACDKRKQLTRRISGSGMLQVSSQTRCIQDRSGDNASD